MDEDDMDEDEAISAAVKHRKHLIIGRAPDWVEKYNDECRKNDKTQQKRKTMALHIQLALTGYECA